MTLPQSQPDVGFLADEPLALVEEVGAADVASIGATAMGVLNTYTPVFLAAFLITLLATPIVRRFAASANVVDQPDLTRKPHRYPVAYLGGIAVFLGLLVAIAISYTWVDMPLAIAVGMVAITFTGLADDLWGWDPRLKFAGQLVAAAALAIERVGVHVAEGLLRGVGMGAPEEALFTIGSWPLLNEHVFYWAGTAIIAVFVLGGCNAANFIDGLDGLLAGTVAIVAIGLLAICLLMIPLESEATATAHAAGDEARRQVTQFREDRGVVPADLSEMIEAGYVGDLTLHEDSSAIAMPRGWSLDYDPQTGLVALEGRSLAETRVVLCLALLGVVLGFLPFNFNPATIFLGDCGSLLLGYMCVVIILLLGDRGYTHLVFAGLVVFAVPIIDTTLAIVRRRLAGVPVSVGDDLHIHHQLLRTLGGVKRAVFALYGISSLFAMLGVSLAALVMYTEMRVRVVYAAAIVLFSFIGVIAVKAARSHQRRAEGGARRAGAVAPDGENRDTSPSKPRDPSA